MFVPRRNQAAFDLFRDSSACVRIPPSADFVWGSMCTFLSLLLTLHIIMHIALCPMIILRVRVCSAITNPDLYSLRGPTTNMSPFAAACMPRHLDARSHATQRHINTIASMSWYINALSVAHRHLNAVTLMPPYINAVEARRLKAMKTMGHSQETDKTCGLERDSFQMFRRSHTQV